ncbi:hypothetical protein ElyMa_001242900 [Elysia marginata]|uniref:Uncharacterized protein n=1 Tax=Elysia marginata TaxID=1093978 RepID=A0AAV4IG60_9GAST|nr:hypothetical protein ElyMa_001242900 [Elysia marginata]
MYLFLFFPSINLSHPKPILPLHCLSTFSPVSRTLLKTSPSWNIVLFNPCYCHLLNAPRDHSKQPARSQWSPHNIEPCGVYWGEQHLGRTRPGY